MPAKSALPSWRMGARLAVHQGPGSDHLAAESLADRLVPQTHAQDRQVIRRRADQIQADSRFVGRAGAWR